MNSAMRWIQEPPAPATFLRELPSDLLPMVGQLLWARGQRDPATIEEFLSPNYGKIPQAERLRDMDRAVARIRQAREQDQRIAVYGDFDTDGVTGVALLYQVLTGIGFDVLPYIPKRIEEGYGLNIAAVEDLATRVGLLITVDCGISNVAEIARAQALGLDVIVLDHHTPPAVLPEAYAVINPKRPGCEYPYKMLAGVGVAFKLVQALHRAGLRSPYSARQLLDVVALGTVTDMAPLDGENRVLVKHGIDAINTTTRPGLKALIEAAAVKGPIDGRAIGWALGPRINAAGRLDDAIRAYHLLLCDNLEIARGMADELNEINNRRRGMTKELVEQAEALARSSGKAAGRIIVVDGEDYPSGIVGLVAGRLVEIFGRPVLVLERGEELCRGSARSIPGFSIVEALAECADIFTKYGGHAMAAGFTLPASRLTELDERLQAIALRDINDSLLERKLRYDAELRPADLSFELLDQMELLQPFGQGNAEPVWAAHELQVVEAFAMGQDRRHLKLKVRDEAKFAEIVAWGQGDRLAEFNGRVTVDVAYTLEANEWQGRRRLQMKAVDLRRSNGERNR